MQQFLNTYEKLLRKRLQNCEGGDLPEEDKKMVRYSCCVICTDLNLSVCPLKKPDCVSQKLCS